MAAGRRRKHYNANNSYLSVVPVRLSELQKGAPAVVERVDDVQTADPIAQRLRDLGFVPGEPVRVVARGPMGGDPLLIQIGSTRFALRRNEAARVTIRQEHVG
jgi:ferrous iron transport protein A